MRPSAALLVTAGCVATDCTLRACRLFSDPVTFGTTVTTVSASLASVADCCAGWHTSSWARFAVGLLAYSPLIALMTSGGNCSSAD